jgi:hypothetical protein
MKRYLLFLGWDYYPSGGWGDFVGDYDDPNEAFNDASKGDEGLLVEGERGSQAQEWGFKIRSGWRHVVDTETKEIVIDSTDMPMTDPADWESLDPSKKKQ